MSTIFQLKLIIPFILVILVIMFIFQKRSSSQSLYPHMSVETKNEIIATATTNNWYIFESGTIQPLIAHAPYQGIPSVIGQKTINTLNSALFLKDIAFSPDKKLVVANSYPQTTSADAAFVEPHLTIFNVVNNFEVVHEKPELTSHRETLNGPVSGYSWSPDGKYISFVQKTSIQLMDTQTFEITTLATDHPDNTGDSKWFMVNPQWLSNEVLLYQDENETIQQIHIQTKEKKELVKGFLPSLSPDKKYFVYVTGRLVNGDINLYNVASGKSEKLFTYLSSNQVASWTPDSNYFMIDLIYGDGTRDTNLYSLKTKRLETFSSRKESRYLQGNIFSITEEFKKQLITDEEKP